MANTLPLQMPQKVKYTNGGANDIMTLGEPCLKHLLLADKLLEQNDAPHQQRARDIRLIALVSGIEEVEIRNLPVSLQNKAISFLDAFDTIDKNEEEPSLDEDLLIAFEAISGPNGESWTQLMLGEPTTGAMEEAERMLRNGRNPYSLRLFQQTLVSKCGDLTPAAIPHLPIGAVNKATRYLTRFRMAGLNTGGN